MKSIFLTTRAVQADWQNLCCYTKCVFHQAFILDCLAHHVLQTSLNPTRLYVSGRHTTFWCCWSYHVKLSRGHPKVICIWNQPRGVRGGEKKRKEVKEWIVSRNKEKRQGNAVTMTGTHTPAHTCTQRVEEAAALITIAFQVLRLSIQFTSFSCWERLESSGHWE